MDSIPVITIDGPVGAGKGTISLALAHHLGWHVLDSGALYRVLALAALKRSLSLEAEVMLGNLAQQLAVRFESSAAGGSLHVILDEEDVTAELRTESCGTAASQVAALPLVRQALLDRQRAFCIPPGLIADGRDMGTVVFPYAPVKIFLTASAEERARRRYKQLIEKGINASISALTEEIKSRDNRDSLRATAPLKPADDALVIDTTGLAVAEVVKHILACWSEKC